MSGIGCGTSGVGIASLNVFASDTRKISRGSTRKLWKIWSRNRNSLARITKLTATI